MRIANLIRQWSMTSHRNMKPPASFSRSNLLIMIFFLAKICAIFCRAWPVTNQRNHYSIEAPISMAITTHVQHYHKLGLCTNNGYIHNTHRLHRLNMPPTHPLMTTLLLLMLGGDIESQPGPLEWPAKKQWARLQSSQSLTPQSKNGSGSFLISI